MNMAKLLETPLPALAADGIKRFFARKGRHRRMLWTFVYLPTLLVGLYVFLFFSDMYVSEASFALRSGDGSEMPSLVGLFMSSASSTTADAYIVQSHISSMDMLEKVGLRLDLRGHYADRSQDVYSRLKANPSKEELLRYWQGIVSVTFDPDKGIIAVRVKAYTPNMAKAVNDAVLACSEELVNNMNSRAHQDALRLTREEVLSAERRLSGAQLALQRFRDDKSMLDPSSTAQSLEQVIAKLETESAVLQAELNAALQVLHPTTPRVQTLETRLQALREQLILEKARLAGLDAQGQALSSMVGDYAQLATEEKFAQEMFVKALAALEAARLRAISQSRYIVPFQPPTEPEESLYPRPLLFTVCLFFVLLALLGISSLVLAAIADHLGD